MDSGNVSAIISACAGIGGVLLGNSFVTIKEVVTSRFKRKKDAEYLAIIVVSHLDRFVNGCLQVAHDDGTEEGIPAGNNGSYWARTVKEPTLDPLDIKVEWKSLPRNLMYAVLRIPDKQEHLTHQLSGIYEFDDFPEYSDYFRARRHGYAELGLEVSAVSEKLRKHAGMPIDKLVPGVWSRERALREIMEKIVEERAAIKKRVDEYQREKAAQTISPSEA
ncbi:hypothetical protein D3C87_358220 [compost metagenome]